jgi:diguanylate cyclase (GGDEF)-like protein/PAS domain S-box-containing protein
MAAHQMFIDRRAARIGLFYAAFGVTWIALSDRFLFGVAADTAVMTAISQWKGFAFVLVSAALLYVVAARMPQAPAVQPPASMGQFGHAALPWVFALVAGAIMLAGMAGVARTAREARDEVTGNLRTVAQIKVDLISSWLHNRRAEAAALVEATELRALAAQWRRQPDEPQRKRLLSQLRALMFASHYGDFWLLDAQGALLLSASGAQMPPPDDSLRRLAREALAGGKTLDTGLYMPPGDAANASMDVLVPFGADGGEPAGVLVLRADAQRELMPLLHARAGIGRSPRILLLRRDGDDLVFLNDTCAKPGAAQTQVALASSTLAAAQLFGPAGLPGQALEGAGEFGQPSLAVAVPVPGTDWFVMAELPKGDLDANVWRDAAWIAVVDALAVALVGSAVYLVWQQRTLHSVQRQQADQEEKLRAWRLLDAITNGSTDAIHARDLDGRFLFVNSETCRVLGRPAAQLIGQPLQSCLSADDAARINELDADVLRAGQVSKNEVVLDTADGERVFLNTMGPLRDSQGHTFGVFGVSRDITERKRAEDTRRQWAMAFESTRDGVVITDTRARIQAVNRAFSEITGHVPQDVLGHTPRLLQSGLHNAAFYAAMWRSVRETGSWQGEVWNRRRNGDVYPQWLTISAVRDEAGELSNYVGVFTDITRIKRSEAELERLAHYDPLTDLPNRRLLQLRLEHAIERGHRRRSSTAILYLDLDGFKTVNDSLGHPAGDELLVCMAKRMRARMREEDTLGRLGGDEFLIVLESLREPGEAAVVARDVLHAVAEPMRLAGGYEAYVTASIGISVHPDDGSTSAVEMLRDADAAMYRAKDQGRNRFCFYTSDLHAEAVAKLELEASLSRALERHEFLLHFQPQVAAKTGRLVGAEALLRWQRNGGPLVPPGEFLPVAERSSLILAIGNWVIETACRQLRRWMDAGQAAPRLAINVSARQFDAGDLDVVLDQALKRHRVPPQCLEVELTESMLMERPQAAEAMLRRLKAIGVTLALDDFGTGYSSLGYLKRFPIDTLKIDQSFVRSIGQGPDGSTIVDAIIGLARRLQLRVVAEGVETAAQADYLQRQGCDELQGYHFGRPLPCAAFDRVVAWGRPLPLGTEAP